MWNVYLRLGRVSNLPTVWSNVLAGLLISADFNEKTFLLLMLSMSIFYLAGMFLNDAFDRNIDVLECPSRPIPSQLITAKHAFTVGWALMAFGFLILVPLGGNAVLLSLVLCGCIVWYNYDHKDNLYAPWLMGLCRAMLYGIATLAACGAMPISVMLVVIIYVAGVSYIAREENSLKLKHPWNLAIFVVPLIWLAVTSNTYSLPFLLLFYAWMAYAAHMALSNGSLHICKSVMAMIAGISLFDAVLIANTKQAEFAFFAIIAFLLTLVLHRRVAGS